MTIHIYNTPTEQNHLIKDISNRVSPESGYSGDVRGAVSVDRPVIVIEDTITTGNYCHIPEFGRYYWIVNRNVLRTGITELTLESDVLMSFAGTANSGILSLPIYAVRTEQRATEDNLCGYNSYIRDSTIQRTVRDFTIVKIDDSIPKFEYPDSNLPNVRQYILGVIG